MGKCNRIRRKKTQVCISALDRRIELNTRTITPPKFGGVDYGEEFTPTSTVWAAITTKANLIDFDKSNTERSVTHIFVIRFEASVSAQTWIRFDDKFFAILRIENIEQRSEYLRLVCTERGLDTQPSNLA